MKKLPSTPVKTLVLCALFAALTAVTAQISVPIGPVPICLATFSVYLAGAVLGAAGGALSQLVYLLLGAVSIPVFAGFSGGAAVLMGPTGGYLVGYIICAWLVGLFADRFGKKILPLVFGMIFGTAACYFLGTAWFMFSTHRGLAESLMLCVVPFLIGDTAKIVVASVLAPRLSHALSRVSAEAGAA